MPETPKPETPKPATPTPKPETPKPATPPKPVTPPSPFRSLPKAVDLPALGTSDMPAEGAFDPQPLGDMFVKPGELFFVVLQGGETAYKGPRTFTIALADRPLPEDATADGGAADDGGPSGERTGQS